MMKFVLLIFLSVAPTNIFSQVRLPLAVGGTRTEILENIMVYLNEGIRGHRVDDVLAFLNGSEVGLLTNQFYGNCELSHTNYPNMTSIIQPPDPMVKHFIYFRKDDLPGNFGQDPTDNARVNLIFAAANGNWIVEDEINQGQNFHATLRRRYEGVLGVAVCRRQKIEWVEVYQGSRYCDIDTWLIFLCMKDEDVQEYNLRHPEEYDTYLGGLTESQVFIDMGRQRCRRRIGAVPRDARISPPLASINWKLEYAQSVFVVASQAANYDYVLIRTRRRILHARRRLGPGNQVLLGQDNQDCRDMSLLRNDRLFVQRTLRQGGEVRQLYDFHWFFCQFVGSPPYRNIYPQKRIHSGPLVKALTNKTVWKEHGREL